MYVEIFVCIHVCICVCLCAYLCMYVCTYTYVDVLYKCVYKVFLKSNRSCVLNNLFQFQTRNYSYLLIFYISCKIPISAIDLRFPTIYYVSKFIQNE